MKKYFLFSLLLFAGGALSGSSWPDKLTLPWAIVPSEHLLYRGPENIKIVGGFGDQVNVSQTLRFKLPAPETGKIIALKFNAVFLLPDGNGNRYGLALRMNNQDLRMLTHDDQFRLMNQGEYLPDSWHRGYKKRMAWFGQANYPMLLTPLRPENGKDDARTYVLDISDLAKAGENTLEIIHAGSIADGKSQLLVSGLKIVEFDPSAVKRAQPPKVLSTEEKTAFLINTLDPALPITGKLRNTGDSKIQMSELFNYFRTRSPRPETLRGNELHRGDTPKAKDKKIADDAIDNKIHSPLNGQAVETYQDKVDFLSNRTQKLNPDWIAQHNRLGFIKILAECYRQTGDEKYASALVRHLDNWCDVAERNYAPGSLPIWSSLDTGVRSKVLCEILDMIIDSPSLTPESFVRYLYILQRHGDFLANSLRTPGNWGITEAEGLAFIGIFTPEFAESTPWARTGLSQLRSAFDEQVYPDGMHKELNWGYHYYGISWFGDSSDLVRLNRRKDLEDVLIPPASFEKMFEIFGACLHPDFRNAAWADAWDEPGLGKMRHAYTRFPQNNLFRYIATERREGTPPENFRHFPDSGFYTVRNGWDADAVHLLARCSPNGGWHCHFDNGTFELFAYGRNLTPDTGNFTYNHAEGRDWFLASARHQTLTLNGENTALAPKHLGATHNKTFTGIIFENQSYKELKHRRAFAFIDGKYVVIFDEALGTACGDVAIHFQTAPGAPVKIDEQNASVHTLFPEGANLLFMPLPQQRMKLVAEEGKKANQGSQQPRPAFRYSIDKQNDTPVSFITALIPYRGTVAPEVQLKKLSNEEFQLSVDNRVFRLRYYPEVPLLELNSQE